ncbi:hypothetical protein, partial [aff. Roholtiella sp. LEGE 12411]|uniref:hypothetical protein n=1 Tax=aff. Roholtiella sp. LEGE 12411 TaxID=1828822 RepID=UPI00187FDF9E
ANREDEEPYRLTRLERVYGFVCGQATLLKHMDALKKVTKLHDHKGVLTVSWRAKPTEEEKEFWQRAWASHVGDLSEVVLHEFDGGSID